MELHEQLIYMELGKIAYKSLNIDEMDFNELLASKSMQILREIKTVLENNRFSDFECVERIVRIFEEFGSDGGNRHDFS